MLKIKTQDLLESKIQCTFKRKHQKFVAQQSKNFSGLSKHYLVSGEEETSWLSGFKNNRKYPNRKSKQNSFERRQCEILLLRKHDPTCAKFKSK